MKYARKSKETTPKVGDLIKLVKKPDMSANIGAKAVVIGFDKRNDLIELKWINKKGSELRRNQMDGCYSSNNFILIESREVSTIW